MDSIGSTKTLATILLSFFCFTGALTMKRVPAWTDEQFKEERAKQSLIVKQSLIAKQQLNKHKKLSPSSPEKVKASTYNLCTDGANIKRK